LTALHEAIALAREQRFEAEQRAVDRGHETMQAAHDRVHDLVLQTREQAHQQQQQQDVQRPGSEGLGGEGR
jgi:hypothetical protein